MLVFLFAKRLESVGNKPVFLIGGATGFIGDPKPTSERQLLSNEVIAHNAECLYHQVSNLFKCEMVNNYDWTHNIDILTFLRKYGKYFGFTEDEIKSLCKKVVKWNLANWKNGIMAIIQQKE